MNEAVKLIDTRQSNVIYYNSILARIILRTLNQKFIDELSINPMNIYIINMLFTRAISFYRKSIDNNKIISDSEIIKEIIQATRTKIEISQEVTDQNVRSQMLSNLDRILAFIGLVEDSLAVEAF